MNIHKINSTFSEHQNFLTQNRKDPITGDSILDGDEVVFCAGCKSVFLKDTWEYLGKQHCEQTETLIEFPTSSKAIHLKTKAELLFYTYLPSESGFTDSLPTINRGIWRYTGRKLSSNHELFNDLLPIFIPLLGGGALAFSIANEQLALIIIIIPILFLFWLRYYLNNENRKKLNTFHKIFKNNVFYISDKNIGLSTSDGIEEYILEFSSIKSLSFSFFQSDAFSSKIGYCTITDKENKNTNFRVNYFNI